MSQLHYIPESEVIPLLDWDKTLEVTEVVLKSVAEHRAIQKRIVINVGKPGNIIFSTLGDLTDEKYSSVACKLLSAFPENSKNGKPSEQSTIILFDKETGYIQAVIAAEEITAWRTAAASAIATKYLHGDDKRVLAILGAGRIGRTHALCLQHLFKFKEVRIWNRTIERANKLVEELNKDQVGDSKIFNVYNDIGKCVQNADVIVTATTGTTTLLAASMVKKGAHINAVRVHSKYHELENGVYDIADVYVDELEAANNDLKWLKEIGVEFKGQIGDLITGLIPKPSSETTTIFQSLGMAIEDTIMGRMIYDLHTATL